MGISAISSTGFPATQTVSDTASLEQQLQQVMQSKLDEQTKAARIQVLEAEIQRIEALIRHKQAQESGSSQTQISRTVGAVDLMV